MGASRHLKRRVRNQGARKGFILILVLVVISMATLAMLTFTRTMLVSNEIAHISSTQLQSQMCTESGIQSIRFFVANPRLTRTEMGGTWSNDLFYARCVLPDLDPVRRGNVTILSPGLDEVGGYGGLRYGLQNESAKLNLNAIAKLDELASDSGTSAEAETGDGTGLNSASTGNLSQLASQAMSGTEVDLATNMLLGLPGMTIDVAHAILDWMDADEEPREYGAEFSDYYAQIQPTYRPTNGPLQSIEQLLLVRGVTPQLLFGYDENRNGVLDAGEYNKMNMGIIPGMPSGTPQVANTDPNVLPPPPLGWAHYLTLHSMEKNVSSAGTPRINVNAEDVQTLYQDLSTALGNDDWASFIVAYRYGGTSGNTSGSPLVLLAQMSLEASADVGGAMGTQLGAMAQSASGTPPANPAPTEPWSASAISQVDMTQPGSVTLSQVLDLAGATVTIQNRTYASPFSDIPTEMAMWAPVVMDVLTTVDAPAIPGRINVMECPRDILMGVPGMTAELVESIIAARADGSTSETRNTEAWLAIEGYLTMDQLRALTPLITCGGDVFKAQVVGYIEGSAAFSRVEVIVSGADVVPKVLFFRRLDHLGRGFDIGTLGQRLDVGVPGAVGL